MGYETGLLGDVGNRKGIDLAGVMARAAAAADREEERGAEGTER